MCEVQSCLQSQQLLLGNLHRVSENCPEHGRVARRCSQGPFIAVILARALGQKFFNVEAWDEHLLAFILNMLKMAEDLVI